MTINLIARSNHIISVSYMIIYGFMSELQDIYISVSHIIVLVTVKFGVIRKMCGLNLLFMFRISFLIPTRTEKLYYSSVKQQSEKSTRPTQLWRESFFCCCLKTLQRPFHAAFWLESFLHRQESIRILQKPLMDHVFFFLFCDLENPRKNTDIGDVNTLTVFSSWLTKRQLWNPYLTD